MPLGEALWPDAEPEEDELGGLSLLSHSTNGQVELDRAGREGYSEGTVTMSRSKSEIRLVLLQI